MNSESSERPDSEWEKKRKIIYGNLSDGIEWRNRALNQIADSQRNMCKVSELLTNDVSRLRHIQSIYENEEVSLRYNPATEGSIDTMMRLSTSDRDNAQHLGSNVRAIRTNTKVLQGAAIVTGSYVASMANATVYLGESMENKEGILIDLSNLDEPSAHDRRTELSSRLKEIDARLSTKLDGAWQTLQDRSKDDRFLQAASSARELVSDLLHVLAPDDQVEAMEWFTPETKNGRPSQRQRAKFVIIGSNNILSEMELQPIYELSDNIRNSYKRLTQIAHLRDYETDLKWQTESLIGQCQIYLLKLLELRNIYFKSSVHKDKM